MPTPVSGVVIEPPSDKFAGDVKRVAEDDAAAVANFIFALLPDFPATALLLSVSPEAVLGLALAIRLRRWESQGFRIHTDAGLPDSRTVLHRVLTELEGPTLKEFVESNSIRTLRLIHDQILWSADVSSLRGDIAMLVEADDEIIDAVANFLIEQVQKGCPT